MSKKLVIVESPTKAKTITQFLGKDYLVKSSYGHIRDLPKSKLGVETEKDFTPSYVIPPKAKKVVSELKKNAKNKEVILATDEDREGEAIAWHLAEALKLDPDQTKRIVFHEITKSAINEALANPRQLDYHLIDAQQGRRVLDRLVGYKLSPLLWKKIRYGLSAGRVQSVAVRLIVDREREIEKFKAEKYWTVEALLHQTNDRENTFLAKLVKASGKTIPKPGLKQEKEVKKISADIKKAELQVGEVKKSEKSRNPLPPYTTSTLQQDAARKLGFSAKKTMFVAQQLYEGINIQGKAVGLITYMRTDSLNLSSKALGDAKTTIDKIFGSKYSLPSPRFYKTKSKSAQEAHEAIRPTEISQLPDSLEQYLTKEQARLYKLIWQRTIACQMAPAIFDSTAADIVAGEHLLRANGIQIKFAGYLQAFAGNNNDLIKENILPPLKKGAALTLAQLNALDHLTLPPPRYTEATLVKALEENGIGRPSTYAPIMSTIIDRGYVEKIEKKFQPQEIGTLVNDLLVAHFPNIVDIKFTAGMENDLDEIASGKKNWVKIIKDFYTPFAANLKKKEKELNKKDIVEEATDEVCEKCGAKMVIKFGRFGKFLACSNYPDCKNTKPLGEEKKMNEELSGEKCDKCGAPMVVKRGRFGMFLGCSKYPDCKNIKPIVKSTGVKCPACNQGEIVEKRSKRGRTFYACNQYPKCKFALWQKPSGERCPSCNSLLVYQKNNKQKCSNKDCSYEK